jgi:hypothetical protein
VQLVISEISQSAPMSLQAVKLLAEYLGNKIPKVRTSWAKWYCEFVNRQQQQLFGYSKQLG